MYIWFAFLRMAQAHIISSYLYVGKRTSSIRRLIYLIAYTTYILFKPCALCVCVYVCVLWWQATDALEQPYIVLVRSFCGVLYIQRASQDARIENNIGRVSMNKICTTEMLMPYFNQKCTYLFYITNTYDENGSVCALHYI